MEKVVNHSKKAASANTKRINLALQGGGAHGAFTWGVLDYLLEDGRLEDGRLEIAAISGTSAGAMNAVALADGFTAGGPDGARAKLEGFWRAMSEGAKNSPIKRATVDLRPARLGGRGVDRSGAGRGGCGYCVAAKQLLVKRNISFTEKDVSRPEVMAELKQRYPATRTVPQIFLDGRHVGGFDDLSRHFSA